MFFILLAMKKNYLTRLALILIALWISFNVTNALLVLWHQAFNPDEFQHVHIAWNIAQGKVLYRDFFEHHGPLFSLVNALIIKVFHLPAAFATFYVFRWLGFTYSLVLCVGVVLLGNYLLPYRYAGWLSLAFFTGFNYFVFKAPEIRPDNLQNMFWIFLVYIALRAYREQKLWQNIGAGILTGLVFLLNMKTLPGLLAVHGVILWLQWREKDTTLFKTTLIKLGVALIAITPVWLYLFINGAFAQYIFYNTVFNSMALGTQTDQFTGNFSFVLTHHLVLMLLFFTGIVLLLDRWLVKDPDTTPQQAFNGLYLVIVTASVLYGAFYGFYAHYYLIFLPLLGIISAYAFLRIAELMTVRYKWPTLAVTALLVFTMWNPIINDLVYVPFQDTLYLKTQRQHLAWVLQHTRRDQPILFTWCDGPGFVFNPDLQYFWMSSEMYSKVFWNIAKGDVFGKNLIPLLESQKVPCIISNMYYFNNVLSWDARQYIYAHYRRHPVIWHLWERYEAPPKVINKRKSIQNEAEDKHTLQQQGTVFGFFKLPF